MGMLGSIKTEKNSIKSNVRRGISVIFVGAVVAEPSYYARADLVSDLLDKSAANKKINDKKRLATSYANFARSRTVTDSTCRFPDNFFGCQNAAELGNVKFLTDDLQIECKGKDKSCSSKSKGTLPSFLGI